MVPLVHFTSSKVKMGNFASKLVVRLLSWGAALFIIALNLKFIFDIILERFREPGLDGQLIRYVLLPVSIVLLPLLIWVLFEPLYRKVKERKEKTVPIEIGAELTERDYKRIGIALEGNHARDTQIINQSMPFLKTLGADLYLIHCVQTATSRFIGDLVADSDALNMENYLEQIAGNLRKDKFAVTGIVGGGEPEDEIVRIVGENDISMIIAGSHGHKFLTDLIYGSTIDGVRHRTRIPVLAIPIQI
jgi:manganese transport protein